MIVAFAVEIKMNWIKSLMSATATHSVMWRVELHVIHFLLLAICKCSVKLPLGAAKWLKHMLRLAHFKAIPRVFFLKGHCWGFLWNKITAPNCPFK